MDMAWDCNQAAPCSALDYGLVTKNTNFAKVAEKLAKE
jgi:hypothetical protein